MPFLFKLSLLGLEIHKIWKAVGIVPRRLPKLPKGIDNPQNVSM
jgi:hypothetical protein